MQLSQFTSAELIDGDRVKVVGPEDHDTELVLLHFVLVQGDHVAAGTAQMQRFEWVGVTARAGLEAGDALGHGLVVARVGGSPARVETVTWSEAVTVAPERGGN